MITYENGDPIITIMPIAVLLDHRLTLIQTRVLGAIFSFRNKDTGVASIKRETIAIRCGYSNRTISEATTQLERLGWLVKNGKGGFSKASEFRVTVPDLGTVPEAGTVPGSPSTTVPDPASKTVPDPGTGIEQSINKVRTENKTSAKSAPVFSHSDMPEIAPELAQELLVYRKSLKKPLTKRAWDLIVSEAHKAGWPVQQAVEYLMAKSWQSFSAEYVQKQPQRTEPVRQRRYV